MRINSKAGTQNASFDGKEAGEGLAIFLSQNANAVSRFRFLIRGMTGEGIYQVGTVYSSPPGATSPTGQLTRMIAAAICPGVTSWEVAISCANTEITEETAEIILASSKCCTAPVGVSRVAERYGYVSGNLNVTETLLPGQVVTRVSATGLGGGGVFAVNGLPTVSVPAGATVVLEPKARITEAGITFNNVDYVIEYLESA